MRLAVWAFRGFVRGAPFWGVLVCLAGGLVGRARPQPRGAPSERAPRPHGVEGLTPSAPLALVRSVPPIGGARRCRASRYARHIGSRYAPVFCRLAHRFAAVGVSQINAIFGAVAQNRIIIWEPSPTRRVPYDQRPYLSRARREGFLCRWRAWRAIVKPTRRPLAGD